MSGASCLNKAPQASSPATWAALAVGLFGPASVAGQPAVCRPSRPDSSSGGLIPRRRSSSCRLHSKVLHGSLLRSRLLHAHLIHAATLPRLARANAQVTWQCPARETWAVIMQTDTQGLEAYNIPPIDMSGIFTRLYGYALLYPNPILFGPFLILCALFSIPELF